MRMNLHSLIGECRKAFRRLPDGSQARAELAAILTWWDEAPDTVDGADVLAALGDAREEMRARVPA